MKNKVNIYIIFRICAVLLTIILAFKFSTLVLYIFLAFIFSLIGKPLAHKISRIKILKHNIPFGVCAMMTVMLIIMFFASVVVFIVPLLSRETQAIANFNYDDLARYLSFLLNNFQDLLYGANLLGEDQTLVGLVTDEIREIFNFANFSNIFIGLMSATGSFMMGLFAVFFLTFFFIKDDIRLDGKAKLLFGEAHAERLTAVSEKITYLLSRYYIGLFAEILIMMILLYAGLSILGVKGALLMAFFGGLLNAIPYLGPLIGVICSCLFGVADCIAINEYHAILSTVIKISCTFAVANIIDNVVLIPYIHSKSVKAHPIEIFLVIIMGGSLAGIMGMFFAIPVYTMIRTTVIELFNYVKTQQPSQ